MLEWFIPKPVPSFSAFGLLLFRLAIGSGFLLHGLRKLKNSTSWMQQEGTPPAPPAIQRFAAVVEFMSGIGSLLGLFSPLASIGILMIMTGALLRVHLPEHNPFVDSPGRPSAESCVIYMAAAALLLALGPGRYSVDQLWTSMAATAVARNN
jgi:putative oxidoreductase